jgi:hypothetical protein
LENFSPKLGTKGMRKNSSEFLKMFLQELISLYRELKKLTKRDWLLFSISAQRWSVRRGKKGKFQVYPPQKGVP